MTENKNVAKLVVDDEINVKFKNLDLKTRRKIYNKCRYFLPYAYHSAAYKLGRWDGYINFATIGGKTYLNLLDDILPIVNDSGYELEIEDNRESFNFDIPKIDKNFLKDKNIKWKDSDEYIILEDHQVEAVNKYIDEPQSIQELSTAAGKTLIIAVLCKLVEDYCNGRNIIIVPNQNLVTQTAKTLEMIGLDVGMFYGQQKDINNQNIICTWQSLESIEKQSKGYTKSEKPINYLLEGVYSVIVDECHSAKANILHRLLTGPFSNCPLRWGLTGTVPKEDYVYVSLISSIGFMNNKVSAKELQDKGFLSNCHIEVLQMIEYKDFKHYSEEKEYLYTDNERLRWIADAVRKISQSGNTLILIDRKDFGIKLNKEIENSVFVYGDIKTSDREKQYDDVSKENNKVLIATYGVASTGIDIPRIFNLVLIEPGKSFVKVIQSIGRGIRKASDKDFVQIYDITSTCKYSKRHLRERKRFYDNAGYPYNVKKVDRHYTNYKPNN